MAHMLGIKKENAHAIIGHIARSRKTGENVDQELSRFNEYKTKDPNKDLYTIYKEEIAECKVQNRKDVNVLASWVITLPKDIEPGSKEEEIFFDTTRDFLKERYPDTYLGDSIHRDEPKSRPHMHYLLIPKVKEIKAEKVRDPETGKLKKTGRKLNTGRYKIALNDLIKRADLIRFHDDLNDRMKQVLGREVQILTGTTAENGGNMNLNQYRAEMERRNALKAQAEAAKKEAAADAALKMVQETKVNAEKEAEKIISEAKNKAAEALKAAYNEKAEIDAKTAQLKEKEIKIEEDLKAAEKAKIEAERIRRGADDTLKTAKITLKAIQKREENLQIREAAIEEMRPDVKAARLKSEIKSIEAEISKIEAMPQSEQDIVSAAYAVINPEIGTNHQKLAKMATILQAAEEKCEWDVVYEDKTYTRSVLTRKYHNLSSATFLKKKEIDEDPQKAERHQQLQKEIKQKTIEEKKRLPELRTKHEQKCEEYAFYGGAAVDLLIKAAPKWQEIAPEIEIVCRKHLLKDKSEKIIRKPKDRGFER